MPPTEEEAPLQPCPNCATLLDTSDEEPLAQVHCPICGTAVRVERSLNNFVLLDLLGRGGMGAVYKARDTGLNRLVALKLLSKKLGDDDHAAELENEARATASVSHPHVVQVYSFGSDHGQFYLAMELVDKGSLDHLMELQTRISEAQVLTVGMQIARGLEAAHATGLIHRDVKPGNILFADAHTTKITDFGLAIVAEKEAESRGEVWGTPYYVAPEKLNNEPEDFRSDIYSLGATLFHAVAGRPPYEVKTNSMADLYEIKSEAVSLQDFAPDVASETSQVIDRMMHFDPAQRFESYEELLAHLQFAHTAVLERANKPRAGHALAGFDLERLKKLPGGLPALLLTVLIIGAGIIFLVGGKSHSKPENDAAKSATSAGAVPAASPEKTQLDEARRQIIEGHYDAAKTQIDALLETTKGNQPLFTWVRMHRGLLYLLGRQLPEAQELFRQVQSADLYSASPADRKLATFFVEASKLLAAPETIPAAVARSYDGKSIESFGLFLFALKDWEQGDFTAATRLFNEFMAAQPPAEFGWIAEYKQIAAPYSEDGKAYAAWLEQLKAAASNEQLSATLATLSDLEGKLKLPGKLVEELKKEETGLPAEIAKNSVPVPSTSETPGAMAAASPEAAPSTTPAPSETPKPADPAEVAAWNAALQTYQALIRAYRFPEALAAVQRPQLTDVGLKTVQDLTVKKAQWMIEWRKKLLADLNATGYPGPVYNVTGIKFDAAITRATETQILLRTPYGTVPLRWLDLAPKMLLAISSSYLKPTAPDLADRAWFSAVFASQTGQSAAATALAQQAGQAKPEYAEQIATVFPPPASP